MASQPWPSHLHKLGGAATNATVPDRDGPHVGRADRVPAVSWTEYTPLTGNPFDDGALDVPSPLQAAAATPSIPQSEAANNTVLFVMVFSSPPARGLAR
jgi:hypothetical protein